MIPDTTRVPDLIPESGDEYVGETELGYEEAAEGAKPRWAFFVMNADGSGVRKVTWALPGGKAR